MTDYKTKAEEYVRQQLPELMELSFGCEVKVTEEYDSFTNEYKSEIYTFRGVLLDIQGPSFDPEVTDGITYYNIRNRDNGCIETHEQGEVEIIGHPIQLHHWLRVLRQAYTDRSDEHYNVAITGSGEVLFERQNSTHNGTGWVYLSNETDGCRIQFNLINGQPATEEDYQAFCEIVGINSRLV